MAMGGFGVRRRKMTFPAIMTVTISLLQFAPTLSILFIKIIVGIFRVFNVLNNILVWD